MTDCEEKTETVASLYSHFFSNLVQGQDPPPLHESAAGWLGCVGGSLPSDIMSHKKNGMQLPVADVNTVHTSNFPQYHYGTVLVPCVSSQKDR